MEEKITIITNLRSRKNKVGAFKVTFTAEDESGSDGESTGLLVQHALSSKCNTPDQWILDSGATCHMCNKKKLFSQLNVTLGDG